MNKLRGPVDEPLRLAEMTPRESCTTKSTYSQLKKGESRAYWVRPGGGTEPAALLCRPTRDLPSKAKMPMPPSSDLLLVEDDLLLARALQRTLVARGIRARHVARCATAAALKGPYVVGVFDIDLPDGDGVDLARLLTFRGVVSRVVFYTACAHQGRLARARDLGSVFVKSSHLGTLMDVLVPRPGRSLPSPWLH